MKLRRLFVCTTLAAGALGAVNANAAPLVYIPLGTANEIAVVDAATDRPVRTIGGVINPHGLAITPDGKTLVAGSNQERPAGVAAVPPKPEGMSEEEHLRHHAPPAGAAPSAAVVAGISHVDLIDAASGRIVRRVDVTGAVHHVFVTRDGRFAIPTHTTAGGVSVLDIAKQKVLQTVATGPFPNYTVGNHDGSRIYVSNAGNGTVSEIDTQRWIVLLNILVGPAPEHMVLSPDDRTLYVANIGDGTVSVVSVADGKVTDTLPVGKEPHGIDLSADGKTLFVTSKDENKLVAIDLASRARRELALDPAPYHVARIAGTDKIYVSSRKLPKIWVVDDRALKVTGEIAVKGEGHQIVVAP